MRGDAQRRGSDHRGIIYLGRGADGQKHYRCLPTVPTEGQAQVMVADAIGELCRETYTEPTGLTVGESLDMWLRKRAKLTLRDGMCRRFKGIVEHYLEPALGHIRLQHRSPLDPARHCRDAPRTSRWRKSFGEAPGDPLSVPSVRGHHRTIHAALGQAVRRQLVSRSVADAVDPRRDSAKPDVRALSVEQTNHYPEVAQRESDYPKVHVLAVTSATRQGKILDLRWQDVRPRSSA